MAFAYTTSLQNRISFAVWNQPGSALNANQRHQLDNTWTSGSLSGGVAYDAYIEVSQLAQYFEQAASTPDLSFPEPAWDRLFVAKAAMILTKTVRPDRFEILARDHETALDEAVDTYTPVLISTSTIAGQAITVAGITAHTVNACVNRKEHGVNQGLRRRLFPKIADIHSAIQHVVVFAWNMAPWNFRKRMIQITINANNTVSMTGLSSETFDSIASQRFFYDSTNFGNVLEWVDSTHAPALKALHGTATGMPRYFRTELNGTTVTWHLFPIPDAAYTLYGTVYVNTPTLTALADINTALTKFPAEFGVVLRKLVVAEVLLQYRASDGQSMWDRAINELEMFGPIFCDTGSPAKQTSVQDVYGDHNLLIGDGNCGAFNYGG